MARKPTTKVQQPMAADEAPVPAPAVVEAPAPKPVASSGRAQQLTMGQKKD